MRNAPRLKCLKPKLTPLNQNKLKELPKKAEPFYTSKPWLSLVRNIKLSRGSSCQLCGRINIRIFADHIRELKDGGAPLDPTNIQLLCGSCHTKKTARTKKLRS